VTRCTSNGWRNASSEGARKDGKEDGRAIGMANFETNVRKQSYVVNTRARVEEMGATLKVVYASIATDAKGIVPVPTKESNAFGYILSEKTIKQGGSLCQLKHLRCRRAGETTFVLPSSRSLNAELAGLTSRR
jgi:hypothetical protein